MAVPKCGEHTSVALASIFSIGHTEVSPNIKRQIRPNSCTNDNRTINIHFHYDGRYVSNRPFGCLERQPWAPSWMSIGHAEKFILVTIIHMNIIWTVHISHITRKRKYSVHVNNEITDRKKYMRRAVRPSSLVPKLFAAEWPQSKWPNVSAGINCDVLFVSATIEYPVNVKLQSVRSLACHLNFELAFGKHIAVSGSLNFFSFFHTANATSIVCVFFLSDVHGQSILAIKLAINYKQRIKLHGMTCACFAS